jgi:hypothetical protein
MAGLVNLTPKTQLTQGFQLQTPEDMLAALKYLGSPANGGYTGNLSSTLQNGALSWQMWLNHPASNSSQIAAINDVIVLTNNSLAKVMSTAQLNSLYTVG